MELSELARALAGVYEYLDKQWEGYDVERITTDDFTVTIAAIVDYLDGVEGPASLEIPNTDLCVVRDAEGEHHVWVRVGEVDLESINQY